MNKPLVSVVVPFFNNESTLLSTIKSVFCQTYNNWELILLDDGSTDGSLAIANSINDERVKVVSDGINRGLVYRLNEAPSLVNSQYIARMDGDDMMHPQRLDKQMNLLMENSSLDLVDTGAYAIDQLGNPIGLRGLMPINFDKVDILKKGMLLHASIIGKKVWFEKYPYDPIYVRAEDRELWLRSYKNSNFARIQEPLYIVREGKVNVKNYTKGLMTVIKIYKAYGPSIFSVFSLQLEIFKSYLKILLINILGFFNIHDLITKRRNIALNTEEENKVFKLLQEIDSIKILQK